MAYRIFLSHSAKDPELLAAVRNAAHAAQVELYTFEDDPQPGANLKEKLLGALQASDAVVALLTPNAAISPTVQQEIGAALQLHKPIIPLFADEVEVARFPFLAEIEYLMISTDEPEASIKKLSVRLGTLKNKKDVITAVLVLLLLALGIWLLARKSG
jgi:hypothetical protein